MTVKFNTEEYFRKPLITATGFREYDARWIIEGTEKGSETGINYVGVRVLGSRLGEFLRHVLDAGRQIVVGHDYRRYSENVKNALVIGLMEAGMDVTDIGLCVTPCAYFAQFHLDIPCVAMVTASHNENGWTGIKMGTRPARTFGPEEMALFREHVLATEPIDHGRPDPGDRGSYRFLPAVIDEYISDLTATWTPRFDGLPRLRVAVETGNGTAGMFLPAILEKLGFEVAPGNIDLDWTFPHFNPNPESIPFLRSVESLVRSSGADIGICIDGDGDRLGVVDERGRLVFSDRIGLLISRHLASEFGEERPIVIDVKSTSLYESQLRNPIIWAKTGHSYVKSAVAEANAIAGFERSGHFFFRDPLGRGYDDACVAALMTLRLLCSARASDESATLSGLLETLPRSFSSPNRQPYVSDETKYDVVEALASRIEGLRTFAGLDITSVNRLNGIRVTLAGGSWLLVRASSNTPNLVILAEAFDQDGRLLREIDHDLRRLIDEAGVDIGDFDPLDSF